MSRKRNLAATPKGVNDLSDLHRRVLETAALVEAAAELAAPLAPTVGVERVRALLAVADRSADEAVGAVERMISRADLEGVAASVVARDRAEASRRGRR